MKIVVANNYLLTEPHYNIYSSKSVEILLTIVCLCEICSY
jgi:hypothetical protein